MIGWCDGSWADLDEKRRSTTGGLLMLGGACVAGWSWTQKPTAMSSGESEFYSATVCACVRALVGLRIFKGVGLHHDCSFERGRICMHWHGNTFPGRLKHVEIKHFALQHWVRQGRPTLDKVTTTEQLADIMTKPYSKQTLATLAPKIGLVNRITDSTTSEASHDWIRTAVIAALTQGVSENTRNRSK